MEILIRTNYCLLYNIAQLRRNFKEVFTAGMVHREDITKATKVSITHSLRYLI